MVIFLSWLSLLACSSSPNEDGLRFRQASPPIAIVGEPYTWPLTASGGQPPYQFALTGGALPQGLLLNPSGAITGTPTQEQSASVSLVVTDDAGQQREQTVSLSVDWAEDMLPCGGTLSGAFTEGALDLANLDVDWEATGGYVFFRLPLPPSDAGVRRIALTFEADGFPYVWQGAPGTPVGDRSMFENYTFSWIGNGITIDQSTRWDLETYEALGEPLTILLTGESAGSWSVSSVCTDGPILTEREFFPTEVGEFIYINYNTTEDNRDVRFSVDGTLPLWTTFNEENGQLSGVAEEAGTWIYDITVADPEGRTRTEPVGFSTFEIGALRCDETTTITLEEGYFEGWPSLYYDSRGFASLKTDLNPSISAVSVTVSDVIEGGLGATYPGSAFRFFGSTHSSQTYSGEVLDFTVSPRSYPSLVDHRLQDDALYTVVYSMYDGGTFSVETVCDRSPRFSEASLPVFTAGVPESAVLGATGGTPPYTFTAADLPDAVTLSPEGVLSYDGSEAGSWDISLEIRDAEGTSSDTTWSLHIGDAAACGDLPRLSCGETQTGRVEGLFWESAEGSSAFCLFDEHDDVDRLTLTLFSETDNTLAIPEPGRTAEDAVDGAYVFLERTAEEQTVAAVLNATSDPSLDRYRHRPLPIVILGYEPGDFALSLQCD